VLAGSFDDYAVHPKKYSTGVRYYQALTLLFWLCQNI